MSLQLTETFLDDLRFAIAKGDREFILGKLDELHPADAAEIPRDPTSAVAARPTANFFDSFMYVFSSV